ncbi:MAG: acylphosphatase [Lewinellaceae bacterium]|nr:acylphosphatase [Lewinellaceae bacterium]
MKHVKLHINGRVQGVAFRAHTRRKALELGLCGFVENRPDGSVYAEIEGPSGQVEKMVQWCRSGPPLARVDAIAIEEGEPVAYPAFEIRR